MIVITTITTQIIDQCNGCSEISVGTKFEWPASCNWPHTNTHNVVLHSNSLLVMSRRWCHVADVTSLMLHCCCLCSHSIASATSIWQSSDSAFPVLYYYLKLTCSTFFTSPHNKYFQPRYGVLLLLLMMMMMMMMTMMMIVMKWCCCLYSLCRFFYIIQLPLCLSYEHQCVWLKEITRH